MIYSDMQTKHFYALKSTDSAAVKNLEDSDFFRIEITRGGTVAETTDIINRKLIKRIRINAVDPIYYRQWTVNAMTSIKAGTTYSLYFYLENMLGMGMQDRLDLVASYTSKEEDFVGEDNAEKTAAAIKKAMEELKNMLNSKLNGAGPIVNDFMVIIPSELSVEDAKTLFVVTPDRTTTTWGSSDVESVSKSGTTYTLVKHEGNNKATYKFSSVNSVDFDINDNILVFENPKSNTYSYDKMDMYLHGNPYAYNLTMSTYDGEKVWGDDTQKEITADKDKTGITRITSGMRVLDMEHYFLRNRGDLYDLNPNFKTSILNETNADETATNYYTLDVDYAFSDTQGFTYHSDKQLSIALCGADAFSTLQTLRLAMLNDTTENSYSAQSNVTYSNANDDDD